MSTFSVQETQARQPVAVITPEFKADSVEQLRQLRKQGPVQRVRLRSGLDAWAVLTYDLAREALTHPALVQDTTPAEEALAAVGYVLHKKGQGATGSMLTADPPDHTRLRRLVAPAFSARRIQLLHGRVQAITTELLDAVSGQDEVDLVEAFTAPLPITVISELLGVPEGERSSFREKTSQFLSAEMDARREAGIWLNQYVAALVAGKRENPSDDLLSDLAAQTNAEDGRLSDAELIGTGVLLVIAGHETTVNLLGNAMVALFRNLKQAELLRERPDLLENAVEEFLRHDSSVEQSSFRFAAADLELGGVQIRRGDVVSVFLAEASRAAPQTGDATVLDVARPNPRHLAFGHGIHYCLGAPLARMEAVIAIGELLRRFPQIRSAVPVEDVNWIPAGMMRDCPQAG